MIHEAPVDVAGIPEPHADNADFTEDQVSDNLCFTKDQACIRDIDLDYAPIVVPESFHKVGPDLEKTTGYCH